MASRVNHCVFMVLLHVDAVRGRPLLAVPPGWIHGRSAVAVTTELNPLPGRTAPSRLQNTPQVFREARARSSEAVERRTTRLRATSSPSVESFSAYHSDEGCRYSPRLLARRPGTYPEKTRVANIGAQPKLRQFGSMPAGGAQDEASEEGRLVQCGTRRAHSFRFDDVLPLEYREQGKGAR